MNRFRWLAGLLVLGIVVAFAGTASAERTKSTRTNGQKSTGARDDITVPYLNNDKNAFRAYSVATKITSSPIVDDPKNPQVKPVYNIIFYGAIQSFGDQS